MSVWKILGLCCVWWSIAPFHAYTQVSQGEDGPAVVKFDEKTWESLTEKADYWPFEKRELKEQEGDRSMEAIDLGGWKYFLLALVILILLAVVLLVVRPGLLNKAQKVVKEDAGMRSIEEDVRTIDLDQWLMECSRNKDYKMAIRVYYLKLLQQLDRRSLIFWHKDKINSDYLRELADWEHYNEFLKATRHFETVWYSEEERIEEGRFKSMEPIFHQLTRHLEQ